MAGIELKAGSVTVPGVSLQDVTLTAQDEAAQGLRLRLAVGRADMPALGWHKVGLTMDGVLIRDGQQRWLLDSGLKVARAPGAAMNDARLRLIVDEGANTLQADVTQAAAAASLALPLDQPSHMQIDLKSLPAGWLQGLLTTVSAVRVNAGNVDASIALDTRNDGIQAAGQIATRELGFDTPTGTLAGERLGSSLRFGLDTANGPQLTLDGSLRGGNLLLGSLYAQLPAHSVALTLDAQRAAGGYQVHHLHLVDADALQLEGSLDIGADGGIAAMQFDQWQLRLPAAYDRYGKSLLKAAGVPELALRGMLKGSVTTGATGVSAFAMQTDGLDATLGDGQLGVRGLHGGLDWRTGQTRPATTLGWRELNIYRIPNGAAQGSWRSDNGVLRLQKPLDIPVLDGKLSLRDVAWQPDAGHGARIAAAMVLTSVDMAALCRALGWPEFHGTLAGAVPSLHYEGGRIVFDGGLALNVFDGFVDITRLSLQQPFGASPVLAADISLRQLDLGVLTGVFDFGNITGRLDGSVQGLRLVDWMPVAFDGKLLASGGGRISQRAVENLTSVGGGSLAAGLQGRVMKLFKSFGYRRIGLNCTLQGEQCRMSGLDTGKDSYTIVEGSGLPRLTVVGHQAQVDWPTLVRRLQAATRGDGPVID